MILILHTENKASKGRNLALIVGVIQLILTLGLLFLPIFGTCMQNEPTCRYQNYIQMGGNVLGFGFLSAMILLGGVVIIASRLANIQPIRSLLWLDMLVCIAFAIVGAWSFGLAFAPIALMLLLADRALRLEAGQQNMRCASRVDT